MAKQRPGNEPSPAPEPAAPEAGSGATRFTVHVPGHSSPRLTVEAADEASAIEAYKANAGVWHLPGEPVVEPAEGGDGD